MDVFVARQPILDAEQHVYGYELLFRSGMENAFPDTDRDLASSRVLSSSMLSIGLDVLTRGKPAFVNFTRDTLLGPHRSFLPSDSAVVEIVEDVEPDEQVLTACRELRTQGYRIALDDFVYRPELEPLLKLADFVKIDFDATTPATRATLVRQLQGRGVAIVAEKVETAAQFREATSLGCRYFQGFFFSRPVVYRGNDLQGHRGAYLQLVTEAARDELDYERLERIVKTDVSLSYKLLRYINTVSFGWKQRITSVRHALSLMGQLEVRRWAMLAALANVAQRRPDELSVMSAVRGRLCESIVRLSTPGDDRALDGFMLGMFSLIDTIMGQPMAEALQGVPLNDDVAQALQGEPNTLRQILDAVIAYERGDWSALDARSDALRLSTERLPQLYAEAVEWAGEVFD